MRIPLLLAGVLLSLLPGWGRNLSLTLIPPSPVSEPVTVEVRAAVWNHSATQRKIDVAVYLDSEARPLHRQQVEVGAHSAAGVRFRWPARGHGGSHRLILKADGQSLEQPVEVLRSAVRTTGKIDGAWMTLIHPIEHEGVRMNPALARMTDDQWREQVRGMHQIEMNVIVLEEAFRHQAYHGKHAIERDGYPGLAFYPSRIFSGRMKIAAKDPFEAILFEADRLGMHVFMGVGLYAWFDFTPGSLAWHKRVSTELWSRYGEHPSFYGWYVSEEVCGDIAGCDPKLSAEQVEQYRREIVEFFRLFREHCQRMAPDKPVMLAPNSHFMARGEATWRELTKYCDIICPFGFHRPPKGDVSGEEVAAWLQKICDESGAHLWMDLEVFAFEKPGNALIPREIEGLVQDLSRFRGFEKILCFQYAGLMNAPWASAKPGGEATVKLFLEYEKYLRSARGAASKRTP